MGNQHLVAPILKAVSPENKLSLARGKHRAYGLEDSKEHSTLRRNTAMQKLKEIIAEIEEHASGLIKLQSIGILKDIAARIGAGDRKEAKKTAQEKWDTLDYEFYAIDRGVQEISLDQEKAWTLYKISSLLEKAQSILIMEEIVAPTPYVGGPATAMFLDRGLPRGKKAYPVLLKELMKAAQK